MKSLKFRIAATCLLSLSVLVAAPAMAQDTERGARWKQVRQSLNEEELVRWRNMTRDERRAFVQQRLGEMAPGDDEIQSIETVVDVEDRRDGRQRNGDRPRAESAQGDRQRDRNRQRQGNNGNRKAAKDLTPAEREERRRLREQRQRKIAKARAERRERAQREAEAEERRIEARLARRELKREQAEAERRALRERRRRWEEEERRRQKDEDDNLALLFGLGVAGALLLPGLLQGDTTYQTYQTYPAPQPYPDPVQRPVRPTIPEVRVTASVTGHWMLEPSLCPDLREDVRDAQIDTGRADRREDRRDQRIVNCPPSAYRFVPNAGQAPNRQIVLDRFGNARYGAPAVGSGVTTYGVAPQPAPIYQPAQPRSYIIQNGQIIYTD